MRWTRTGVCSRGGRIRRLALLLALCLTHSACAVDNYGFPLMLARSTCSQGANTLDVWSLGGHFRLREAPGYGFGYNAISYLFASPGCPDGRCSDTPLPDSGPCKQHGEGQAWYFWGIPWPDDAEQTEYPEHRPVLVDVRNLGVGIRVGLPLPGLSLGYEATTTLANVREGESIDRVLEYERGAPEHARVTLCKGEPEC